MYRVTSQNGFVVECETVEEVRALLGESAASTTGIERVRRKRPDTASPDEGKQAMGSGPKRKWAIAAWYAQREKITKNEAWLKLGAMRKDDAVAYATLEQEFDGKKPAKPAKQARRKRASA